MPTVIDTDMDLDFDADMDVTDDEFGLLTKEALTKELEVQGLPDADDRRSSPRATFDSMAEMSIDGVVVDYANVRNLSLGGAGVRVEQDIAPDTEVDFVLHLPHASLQGRGIVRHCMPVLDDQYDIGIEFLFD